MSEDNEEMYQRVWWIRPADMEILNILGSPKSLKLTSGNIATNIGYSREYVADRCRLLADVGALSIEENGYPFYMITDLGERIVNRMISVEDLEEIGPEPEDEE